MPVKKCNKYDVLFVISLFQYPENFAYYFSELFFRKTVFDYHDLNISRSINPVQHKAQFSVTVYVRTAAEFGFEWKQSGKAGDVRTGIIQTNILIN